MAASQIALNNYPTVTNRCHTQFMQDLAIIVSLMLLAQLAICLSAIAFAIVYRAKGKFSRTSAVFVVLMALLAAWGYTLTPGFAYAPGIAFFIAAPLRFLPLKK